MRYAIGIWESIVDIWCWVSGEWEGGRGDDFILTSFNFLDWI